MTMGCFHDCVDFSSLLDHRVHVSASRRRLYLYRLWKKGLPSRSLPACIDALEIRQQDSGLWDASMTMGVSHDSADRISLAASY